MRSKPFHDRRGMSLAELLVVVAILGLLVVTVVPTLATTAESRRGREASRTISTFIAQAQARAVGRTEWSGFWIIAASNASPVGTDLVFATVPEIYRGDTVDASVQVGPSDVSSTGRPRRTLSFSPNAIGMVGSGPGLVNVQSRDLIRLGGKGPWYELVSASSGAFEICLRTHETPGDSIEDAGQTKRNTPWPTSGVSQSFEILRYPESAGTPSPIPNGRVIDLYWSGFGPDGVNETFATGETRFYANTSTVQFGNVAILFDSTGRVRKVVAPDVVSGSAVSIRKTVTGPILLLVGRADRAGQAPATLNAGDDTLGANWQYADSYWIGIDPVTGVVRTAACTPGAATVVASQAWIRQNLLESGG